VCLLLKILYPSIGGAPAYRGLLQESFDDARCTFENWARRIRVRQRRDCKCYCEQQNKMQPKTVAHGASGKKSAAVRTRRKNLPAGGAGRREIECQAKCCKQRKSGTCKPGFDLEASSGAAQTPFAEVLTVIGQQPIAVFPHPRSCSADDLSNIEIGRRVRSHQDALSAREMSERNLFHRFSAQTVRAPRVVNDLASTDVDAVMQIASPRCDKVRTQRGFLVPDQEPLATELPAS
jgi:hypothetical protein